MPGRIYKLHFQEKNPGPGSNFSLENLIWMKVIAVSKENWHA